ncbi:hypothetical protein [Chitinophaga sp. CF418]|uniref:DUF6934 family protein n=1 Tax=Chitinophaga sp. CF418 TaxID=1855287 RepID=UPI00091951B2|nr:hypothetical protein [Chitinophaga sp. CF418]SHL99428.1 hypothetical protein SAMN05216311_101331 [Chitinophaga sp. CF418]
MITINFEETFEPTFMESDFSMMTFNSPQIDGSIVPIIVKIDPHPDPYLPGVYNLGFGPSDGQGEFSDDIRLRHENIGKVFSTVLFHGLTFLQENPELILGIDGSDDLRATLYHLMVKSNRVYLSEFFVIIGVDWYVRVFRDGNYELDADGNLLSKPKSEQFDYERTRHDLYRYYMFHLK